MAAAVISSPPVLLQSGRIPHTTMVNGGWRMAITLLLMMPAVNLCIMRYFLLVFSAFLCTTPAAGQAWKPDKPVEIIVTCQPGCGPDGAARLIQRIWQEHRIVTVPSVVVNRAGGGGAAAFGYLAQKPGDGHALVLSGS